MAAGGLTYFLCYGSAWIVLASLHEAPGCQREIHGRTGDMVELPSCLLSENVTFARWTYNKKKVASADDKDGATEAGQFTGRAQLNRRNFSLTLRDVTLKDSGLYLFVSMVDDTQQDTVQITLKVHEPINAEPVVTVNATQRTANHSCKVLLHCSAPAIEEPVGYKWRVGNQSLIGRWHWVSLPPWGGATEVTCTVFNAVSAKSASASVTCTNDTAYSKAATDPGSFVIVVSVAVGAFCMLIVVASVIAAACRGRRRQATRESEEVTIYADIGDVAPEYTSVRTTEPHSKTPSVPMQTLYDEIRLSRMVTQKHAP